VLHQLHLKLYNSKKGKQRLDFAQGHVTQDTHTAGRETHSLMLHLVAVQHSGVPTKPSQHQS
jgi:hypothetical protein